MRKAALIALTSAFCLGTAAPGVARAPDPPSHLTKKHGKKHHKAGNSGHEGRAPGAGH